MRTSVELDTARITFGGTPARLFIASFAINGLPNPNGRVELIPESSDDPSLVVVRYTSPEGTALFTDVAPGRYEVKINGIALEEQTQALYLLPSRTDTLCFAMRMFRVTEGFERRIRERRAGQPGTRRTPAPNRPS